MNNGDTVSKEEYDSLLMKVKELLEQQKKSQKKTDELIEIATQVIRQLVRNPDHLIKERIVQRNISLSKKSQKKPAIFIHVVPKDFRNDEIIDITSLGRKDVARFMIPFTCAGGHPSYNAEGFACIFKDNNGEIMGYDQILRNGLYESYRAAEAESQEANKYYFHHNTLKGELNIKISNIIQALLEINKKGPYQVYLNYTDIENAYIYDNRSKAKIDGFNVNSLSLPIITIEESDDEIAISKKLNPIMDIIWQAGGHASYNRQIG